MPNRRTPTSRPTVIHDLLFGPLPTSLGDGIPFASQTALAVAIAAGEERNNPASVRTQLNSMLRGQAGWSSRMEVGVRRAFRARLEQVGLARADADGLVDRLTEEIHASRRSPAAAQSPAVTPTANTEPAPTTAAHHLLGADDIAGATELWVFLPQREDWCDALGELLLSVSAPTQITVCTPVPRFGDEILEELEALEANPGTVAEAIAAERLSVLEPGSRSEASLPLPLPLLIVKHRRQRDGLACAWSAPADEPPAGHLPVTRLEPAAYRRLLGTLRGPIHEGAWGAPVGDCAPRVRLVKRRGDRARKRQSDRNTRRSS